MNRKKNKGVPSIILANETVEDVLKLIDEGKENARQAAIFQFVFLAREGKTPPGALIEFVGEVLDGLSDGKSYNELVPQVRKNRTCKKEKRDFKVMKTVHNAIRNGKEPGEAYKIAADVLSDELSGLDDIEDSIKGIWLKGGETFKLMRKAAELYQKQCGFKGEK